jgi:hypothetical protein
MRMFKGRRDERAVKHLRRTADRLGSVNQHYRSTSDALTSAPREPSSHERWRIDLEMIARLRSGIGLGFGWALDS